MLFPTGPSSLSILQAMKADQGPGNKADEQTYRKQGWYVSPYLCSWKVVSHFKWLLSHPPTCFQWLPYLHTLWSEWSVKQTHDQTYTCTCPVRHTHTHTHTHTHHSTLYIHEYSVCLPIPKRVPSNPWQWQRGRWWFFVENHRWCVLWTHTQSCLSQTLPASQ